MIVRGHQASDRGQVSNMGPQLGNTRTIRSANQQSHRICQVKEVTLTTSKPAQFLSRCNQIAQILGEGKANNPAEEEDHPSMHMISYNQA
ncbi:hypothetical protein BDV38DRAFT_125920 [Aspergillus pseudotamarii]|uniref:Uncharacterized protein n=1 Tax=Aspergillus pseudotamarii TaxID=132259 RepID=A0A5N6T853_ASPPS|nr:uncharacterized protein BDV38DRAFT_125920 [Aspergillus pseudotamarii]KAE8142535.1 hypothetical protein BDV38DRAFT_125920 [Aspergillus pseudotamarii]